MTKLHPEVDVILSGEFEQTTSDPCMTPDQFIRLFTEIKLKYGANAIVSFDAGYNNVSMKVQPSKKVKE